MWPRSVSAAVEAVEAVGQRMRPVPRTIERRTHAPHGAVAKSIVHDPRIERVRVGGAGYLDRVLAVGLLRMHVFTLERTSVRNGTAIPDRRGTGSDEGYAVIRKYEPGLLQIPADGAVPATAEPHDVVIDIEIARVRHRRTLRDADLDLAATLVVGAIFGHRLHHETFTRRLRAATSEYCNQADQRPGTYCLRHSCLPDRGLAAIAPGRHEARR